MSSVTLNIHDYLKQISSEKDQSITRLISSLENRNGFGRIRLLNDPTQPIALSIQYNPGIITGQQIIQVTQTIADNLNRIFGHLLVKISDLYSKDNLVNAEKLFRTCKGVTNVLAKPRGWVDLEFNRYITEEVRLLKCINQNR